MFHDVSESRELNRKLSYHASHDILTGLVNRREFESRLERALKSARAREASYALCHIDLDQFKIINDNCGHSAGDALLGQVGALLKSKIRWRDTVSRLGGDEFGVLLESCSLEEAVRNAEVAARGDPQLQVRLGRAHVPARREHRRRADLAGERGRRRAAVRRGQRLRGGQGKRPQSHLQLPGKRHRPDAPPPRDAVGGAHQQCARRRPLRDLPPGHPAAAEAADQGLHYELLLRMRDEAGKIVAPDQFIAAAERYGLTPNIDRWMIEHALRWLVSEADEREKLELCSINLSGQSLGDDKFLPFVIDHFHRSGIDASKICFEITETAAIASFSQANRFIHALKELGCRFALDDFGTGLSSFGYLKHFPVDFLKIDGSFVKEILHDPIDREMVRSINEIGHLTGKQTIAEFAENVGDHRDAAQPRRRLRAGLRRSRAAARDEARERLTAGLARASDRQSLRRTASTDRPPARAWSAPPTEMKSTPVSATARSVSQRHVAGRFQLDARVAVLRA